MGVAETKGTGRNRNINIKLQSLDFIVTNADDTTRPQESEEAASGSVSVWFFVP